MLSLPLSGGTIGIEGQGKLRQSAFAACLVALISGGGGGGMMRPLGAGAAALAAGAAAFFAFCAGALACARQIA